MEECIYVTQVIWLCITELIILSIANFMLSYSSSEVNTFWLKDFLYLNTAYL